MAGSTRREALVVEEAALGCAVGADRLAFIATCAGQVGAVWVAA